MVTETKRETRSLNYSKRFVVNYSMRLSYNGLDNGCFVYECTFFRALRVRKKTAGERMPVQVIGDILSSELSHMQAYIRFCSCQLNAASLLQQKTDASLDFKLFLKVKHTS